MTEIFGIPTQALFGQLLIGLINGAFYAMLSLGPGGDLRAAQHHQLHARRAVHAGRVLRVLPAAVRGAWATGGRCSSRRSWSARSAIVIERTMLSRLYKLDHLYGLLLTFGLALIIQGVFTNYYGCSGLPYRFRRSSAGGVQPGLHVPAQIPRVGDRRLAHRLPRHLVRHRAHQARLVPARRDRESGAGAGVRHQRAAHDHADLRLRRGARRVRRRDGRADLPGQPADGREPHHRRVRRRRDRRHGLDPRRRSSPASDWASSRGSPRCSIPRRRTR